MGHLFQSGRYASPREPRASGGWGIERLIPPSRLFGAHGLRTGPDGRIYIAQVTGSQISALDVDTGQIEAICPQGGDIIGPDDLAFDANGAMYVTEPMEARVSVHGLDGRTRVLRGDLPDANGITFHQDRLFVDESRPAGRLMELDLNGGAPKVLLDGLPLPNALEAGPDGLLYFPLIGANEIWRVHPDGGEPERVVGDLHHPVAVKFSPDGFIVSPQSSSGEVLQIDPRSGATRVLARLDAGLDNVAFKGSRLFASHMHDGRITELLADGNTKIVTPAGLHWPLDLAVGADGRVYFADGFGFYVIDDGRALPLAKVHDKGAPHGIRGVAAFNDGSFAVTTWSGVVARYKPGSDDHEVLAQGLNELIGVTVLSDGLLAVAEYGEGRLLAIGEHDQSILADGLIGPSGVAAGADGSCFVSEADNGRVLKVSGARRATVADGFVRPHGIAVSGAKLYVLDVGEQCLISIDLEEGTREVVASNLPVGAPPGVKPKRLRGVPWFSGPMEPFAGIATGRDGAVYVSADGDGSVLAICPSATGDR